MSATASVRFSHDLATRDTDSRVSLPKRPVAERAQQHSRDLRKDARWEQGGSLSGALNPKYQKTFGGLREQRQEQQQQSKANRRRGGGRRRPGGTRPPPAHRPTRHRLQAYDEAWFEFIDARNRRKDFMADFTWNQIRDRGKSPNLYYGATTAVVRWTLLPGPCGSV